MARAQAAQRRVIIKLWCGSCTYLWRPGHSPHASHEIVVQWGDKLIKHDVSNSSDPAKRSGAE